MNAPANLPASGTKAKAAMVCGGSFKNSRLRCRPAEAKNKGTNKPSAVPCMPGMMSRRT